MTQPPSIEALTGALRADVDAVWQRILREQIDLEQTWLDLTPPQRLRRLRALQASVRTLADSADEIAARHITGAMRDAYETGAWATATAAGAGAVFDAVDLDAVTRLAQDTMNDLLHATRGVRDATKTMVRMMTRDWVRTKLYTGLTAEQAGVRLAADLADRGITSVIYANGSRVGLSTYTDMVTRTRTAEAYQAGGFNQGERLEIQWWEVFDGSSCGWEFHDDTLTANGMIVSLDDARAYPISHPNCVMPGTVSGFYGGVQQLVRAQYNGPAYTLTWGIGAHTATVGPNHPVLTARGWVRACLLREGDQLVHDTLAPRPATIGTATEADLEHVPPAIEDQFEALRSLGTYTRVPATRDDLHGDAVFCQGDIDVVDIDRELLVEDDPTRLEQPTESHLVWADVVAVEPVAQGPLVQLASGARLASDGVMGSLYARGPLLRGGRGGGESGGLGQGAGEPAATQPRPNRHATHSDALSNDRTGHSLVYVHADQDIVGDGAGASGGTPAGRIERGRLDREDLPAPLTGRSRGQCAAELLRARECAEPLAELGRNNGESRPALLAGLVDAHRFLLVTLDHIDVGHHVGWVYDATTVGGAFTANGIVVKNCQRSTTPRPDIHNAQEARHAEQTTTAQQRTDQAAAETARAAAHAQIPRRVGLDRRVAASRQRSQDLQIGVVRSPAQQRHLARLATKGPAPALPSEVATRVVAAATAVEPQLTAGMTALADQVGGTMAGLEYRLKTVKSLTKKITDDALADGKTAQQVADRVFDVNRYTILLKPDQYARSAQAAINQLRADGNALTVKNYWRVPLTTNSYQGINVQITKQGGQRLELQFHTEASLHVKEHELHGIYDLKKVEKDPLKLAAYTRQSIAAAEKIPVPRGVAAVS